MRAAGGDAAGQLERCLPGVGVGPGGQAQRDGLGAAHHAAGEGQLLGHVPADQLGQELAAGHVGDQAPPDLQHRHPRVRCHDADVGAERDLQAAAQGVAGHRRDDRDGQFGPDVSGALPGGPRRSFRGRQVDLHAEPLAVPHGLERAEVQPCAEVGPLAGQHDGADAGFGLEPLPRHDQAGEHRVIEGVALLRPV